MHRKAIREDWKSLSRNLCTNHESRNLQYGQSATADNQKDSVNTGRYPKVVQGILEKVWTIRGVECSRTQAGSCGTGGRKISGSTL